MTEDKDKIIMVRCLKPGCNKVIGVQKNANYGKWSDHTLTCVSCFIEELTVLDKGEKKDA